MYMSSCRANVELPTGSNNVLDLDGVWRFALHSCPEDALASGFFRNGFEEKDGGRALDTLAGVSGKAGGGAAVVGRGEGGGADGDCGGVRGADGAWRDTPVPSCWQMQVTARQNYGCSFGRRAGCVCSSWRMSRVVAD